MKIYTYFTRKKRCEKEKRAMKKHNFFCVNSPGASLCVCVCISLFGTSKEKIMSQLDNFTQLSVRLWCQSYQASRTRFLVPLEDMEPPTIRFLRPFITFRRQSFKRWNNFPPNNLLPLRRIASRTEQKG